MKDTMEIIKSSYCECDAPLIRTGEFNKEYCGICGKDIDTIK